MELFSYSFFNRGKNKSGQSKFKDTTKYSQYVQLLIRFPVYKGDFPIVTFYKEIHCEWILAVWQVAAEESSFHFLKKRFYLKTFLLKSVIDL